MKRHVVIMILAMLTGMVALSCGPGNGGFGPYKGSSRVRIPSEFDDVMADTTNSFYRYRFSGTVVGFETADSAVENRVPNIQVDVAFYVNSATTGGAIILSGSGKSETSRSFAVIAVFTNFDGIFKAVIEIAKNFDGVVQVTMSVPGSSTEFRITAAPNTAPTVAVTCPASVVEPGPINCTILVSDPDTPITCAKNTADTCGGTLTGCTTYNLADSTGFNAISPCTVSIDATDSHVSPKTGNGTASVTVTVASDSITLNCPANVNEDAASLDCTVTASAGISNCTIGGGDTCGGSIDALCAGPYTSTIVPDENAGPSSCTVEVTKGAASSGVINVTIDEVNQNPTWFTAPVNVTVSTGAPTYGPVTNGVLIDADLPSSGIADPGYIASCAIQNDACSGPLSFGTAVTVSGSGDGSGAGVNCTVSFVAAGAGGPCAVDIIATDAAGGTVTGTINITVDP